MRPGIKRAPTLSAGQIGAPPPSPFNPLQRNGLRPTVQSTDASPGRPEAATSTNGPSGKSNGLREPSPSEITDEMTPPRERGGRPDGKTPPSNLSRQASSDSEISHDGGSPEPTPPRARRSLVPSQGSLPEGARDQSPQNAARDWVMSLEQSEQEQEDAARRPDLGRAVTLKKEAMLDRMPVMGRLGSMSAMNYQLRFDQDTIDTGMLAATQQTDPIHLHPLWRYELCRRPGDESLCRKPNVIYIRTTYATVSGLHFSLSFVGGVWELTDVSRFGTLIDGIRAESNTPTSLTPGTVIHAGDVSNIPSCVCLHFELTPTAKAEAEAADAAAKARDADQRTTRVMVKVPEGMRGGQTCEVDTPSGVMAVQIPVGLQPGARFAVEAPALTTMPSRLTGEPSGSRRIKNGLKAWRMKSSLRRPRRPSSPASSSEA